MKTLHRYRCGPVVYDEREPSLTVAGVRVDIQPLPLAVLALLIEHAGEVVAHRQLFIDVWKGEDTSPQVLPNAIKKLRDALGPVHAALIVSVPRVGYRFDAVVEATVVGRRVDGQIDLSVGDPIAARPGFRAERRLDSSAGHDVWIAVHRDTGVRRVFKFAADTAQIEGLKREVTISQTLARTLGPRDDIVPLLAWTLDETPCFLEMDYGGESLDHWARTDGALALFDRSARLALFEQIARTVADAHGVGVLHGDLKPGNVLVCAEAGAHGDARDRAWRTRLVDFGSGRLLDTALPAALDVTAFGATAALDVGHRPVPATLRYAAPELLDGLHPLSVKTDVYALGLLLYQIVVGDFQRTLQPGWEREVGDPLLVEDIARAADGDPASRMASVDELRTALSSHDRRRADAATEARTRRTLARRPWLFALGLALTAGFAVSTTFYIRSITARHALEREVDVTASLNRFLTDDLIAPADPSVSGRFDVTVAEAASAAAQRIDTAFATSRPAVRAALHRATQSALHGLKQPIPSIAEGRAVLRESDDGAALDLATEVGVRSDLAIDLAETNRPDDAARELARAEARLATAPAPSATLRATLSYAHGYLAAERQAVDEMQRAYEEAWRLVEHEPSVTPEFRDRVAFGLVNAARGLGHWSDAERLAHALEREQVARWGSDDWRACRTAVAIASAQNGAERQEDALRTIQPAVACLRRKLGPTSTRTLDAIGIEAGILFKSRRFREAATLWGSTIAPYTAVTGPDANSIISLRTNVASALRLAGDTRAAEEAYSELLALTRPKQGDDAPVVQGIRYHLAGVILAQHRTARVDELLDGLRAELLNRNAPQDDWDARLDMRRGELALEKHDRPRAHALMKRALRRFEQTDAEVADRLRAKMNEAGLSDG